MDNELYQNWTTNGAVTSNFETNNQIFKVTEDNALIDNISLEAGEIRSLQISFNFLSDEITDKKEFKYHFIQRDKATEDIISGKTFIIKKEETETFDADAGNDKEIDKNQSVTLSAVVIDEPATYNWYDPEGNLIYTGVDFTLSPELTKKYTLEVILDEDGTTAYDEVEITVNLYFINSISPNPTSSQVHINYEANLANSAYFIFTNVNSNTTYNHIINTYDTSVVLDISTYPNGIYIVSLVCDGTLIETQQLLIN